jgi:hypothetical protein
VGSRITVHGLPIRLNAAAAQAIGPALHELSTNAGKYGALSVDAGRVDVRWGLDGDVFGMSWTECNGPPVSLPKRRGGAQPRSATVARTDGALMAGSVRGHHLKHVADFKPPASRQHHERNTQGVDRRRSFALDFLFAIVQHDDKRAVSC